MNALLPSLGKHNPREFVRTQRGARRSPAQAMTLIELMIAMFVFALVSTGIIGSTLQSRRLAELNVQESTATTVAQGYLEQMKRMPYPLLDSSVLSLVHPEDTALAVSLTKDVWNRLVPSLDINNTPTNSSDDLVMELRPSVTYLLDAADAPIQGTDCYEIVLRYRFRSQVSGAERWHEGNLRLIRSFVRNFP